MACLDAATISDITVAFFDGSMIDDHFQAPTPDLRESLAAAAADTEAGTVPYAQDGVEGGGVDDPTTPTSAPGKDGAGNSVEDVTGGGGQGNDDEAGGAGAGEPGLTATDAAATTEGAGDEAAAGEGGAGSSVEEEEKGDGGVGEVDSAGGVGAAGDTGGDMGENGGRGTLSSSRGRGAMMIPKLDFSNLGGGVGGGVGGGGGATLLPTLDQRAAAINNPEEEEEGDEKKDEEGGEEKAIVGEAGGERTPMGLPRRGAKDKRAAAVGPSPNGKENANVRSDTMDVRTPVFRKGRESLKGGRESVGSRHRRRVMIYRPSLAPTGTPGQPVNLLAAAEESERAGVIGGGEPGSSGSLGSAAGESRGPAGSIGSAGGTDMVDRQLWGNTTFDHLAEEYNNPGSPRTPEDLARAFKRGDGGGPGALNLHQLQKCLGAYISEWREGGEFV